MADPQQPRVTGVEILLNELDTTILSYVEGSFGQLTDPITNLWKLMFIVVIALYGYSVIANGQFSAREMIIHAAKMLLVLVLATQWTEFQIFLMNIMTNTPAEIAGELVKATANDGRGTVDNANTALGRFYDKSNKTAGLVFSLSGYGFMAKVYSLIILIGGLLVTAYSLTLIAIAKVAVAVLLAVAPIFILMLVFAHTKALFEGWLRALINFALIPIFVYALLALMLVIANKPLDRMVADIDESGDLLSYIAPFILSCLVAVGVLRQVTPIAAAIAGGIALNATAAGAPLARLGSLTTRYAIPGYLRGSDWLYRNTPRGARWLGSQARKVMPKSTKPSDTKDKDKP